MKRRKNQGPIVARENAMFEITLSTDDRSALLSFIDQLTMVLESGPDDARLRRLFPTAYHQNPEQDAEYQGYMRDELTQSRAASIAIAKEILESTDLMSASQLHAFMTVLNNLRLVLGTLLDVSEDDHEDEIDENDPSFGQWQLYGYLGWLLEWTISALSGEDN